MASNQPGGRRQGQHRASTSMKSQYEGFRYIDPEGQKDGKVFPPEL